MQLSVVGVTRTCALAGLWMGFLVSMVGCLGDGGPTASVAVDSPSGRATEKARAALAATPTRPTDDMEAFEQALVQRFDGSRVTERELPGGAVLEIPHGYAGHAAILVKGPDGKPRRECVASAAEVTAVVKRLRQGASR